MSVSPSRPIAPVIAADHGGKKKRRRKRHYYNYTVRQKISIIQKAYSKPKYVAKFAREYVWLVTLTSAWTKMLGKLKEKAQVNPRAKSVRKGPVVTDLAFEQKVKDWIISQREMDIAVHTKDIINHVIHVNPSFKNSSSKKLIAWVYKFLGRHGLSVHRVT
jgi:hypothetical protein